MEYPKAGQYVVFDQEFHIVDGTTIEVGTIMEILRIEMATDYQEKYKYFIYLGTDMGYVLEINFTLHHKKLKIIPNTEAAKVLYGK